MRELMILNCSLEHRNLMEEYWNKSLVNDCAVTNNRFIELVSLIGVLVMNIILCVQFIKQSATFNKIDTRTFLRTTLVIILVLCIPMLTILIILAFVYKMVCSVFIKSHDKRFVKFLDSFDVFWSLDNGATINVIGIVEANTAESIVDGLKEKLLTMPLKDGTEKVFYRRKEEYGFYYWRKYSFVDIDQYVQMIEVPGKYQLVRDDLEDIMSKVCNQSLPYDNEGLFKIFVTKQRVGDNQNEKGDYGLIIRIHHSVGDGVALIEFLCRNLAGTDSGSTDMFAMPETQNHNSPRAVLDMIGKLCEMPLCLVDMMLRKPDENTLHGPSLLGLKVVKWTESDEDLLKLVKEVKENIDNFSFSAVLMAALGNGLHNFFKKTKAFIPNEVAVILPIRIPVTSGDTTKNNSLQNNFSVTIHDLAIQSRNIEDSKKALSKLRNSADPLCNHYIIKLAGIFPKQLLRPLLASSQATMVFSNMPGPDLVNICEDHALKSMVFFLPHSGNTGLGVTALSYGGVLRLAVMADKVLVSDPRHLAYILDGMVDEIKRLHRYYVK